MTFSPDLCALVLAGTKTQTRRPVRPGVPCRYHVGRTYAIQPGRGKRAVGRLRVLTVARVAVCAISTADAVAEGFRSGVEFMERWRAMYGNVDGDCWRIEFALEAP